MDADLYARLQYELKLLVNDKREHEASLRFLQDYADLTLKKSVHPGSREYFYSKARNTANYKYLGSAEHPDVIRIREAVHHKTALTRIDNNIQLVSELLEGYLPYDYRSVDAALPPTYKTAAAPLTSEYQLQGRKWKDDRIAFQARFPENYPEFKTEQTSDGIFVKTLSELLIYESFRSAGLFQIYELPLVSNDYGPTIYPDFTVLSPIDFKTEIIVEYVGRLDLQNYREDFAKRIHRYLLNGYIPGVNLFFIFGDLQGRVDTLQINKVIRDIKGVI